MRRDTKEKRILQLVGGLVSGQPITVEAVSALWRISKGTAEKLIAEAEERLAQSATINRDAEIGKARRQCEEIYRLAISRNDLRNALAARNELSRLLALDTSDTSSNSTDEEAVERARMALCSLGVVEDESLPIDELARQVVLYILTNKKSGEL